MNSLNFKIAKTCTRLLVFVFVSVVHVQVRAWDIDFSRRAKDLKSSRGPASLPESINETPVKAFPQNLNPGEYVENFVQDLEPTQEIVILNTETGFIPETVSLRKGQNYKIHVVNVNEKSKNASFILDAFAEHHATFYGQHKTFNVSPKLDGVFSFQCPETAKQGRLLVYSGNERLPATNIQPIAPKAQFTPPAVKLETIRRYTPPAAEMAAESEPMLRISEPVIQETLGLPTHSEE